jgi:hypothetical protein
MQKLSRVVLGVSMLAVGCAVGAASRFAVPPASAQQRAYRWQYLCFEEDYIVRAEAKANTAGREGWEMSGAAVRGDDAWFCFKRPVF